MAGQFKSLRVAQEIFEFDLTQFRNLIAYKSVELNNGALLTADHFDFDNVFHKHLLDRGEAGS